MGMRVESIVFHREAEGEKGRESGGKVRMLRGTSNTLKFNEPGKFLGTPSESRARAFAGASQDLACRHLHQS